MLKSDPVKIYVYPNRQDAGPVGFPHAFAQAVSIIHGRLSYGAKSDARSGHAHNVADVLRGPVSDLPKLEFGHVRFFDY